MKDYFPCFQFKTCFFSVQSKNALKYIISPLDDAIGFIFVKQNLLRNFEFIIFCLCVSHIFSFVLYAFFCLLCSKLQLQGIVNKPDYHWYWLNKVIYKHANIFKNYDMWSFFFHWWEIILLITKILIALHILALNCGKFIILWSTLEKSFLNLLLPMNNLLRMNH